jgi:hypothetical protein
MEKQVDFLPLGLVTEKKSLIIDGEEWFSLEAAKALHDNGLSKYLISK